jgi:hypothetical protein
LMTDFMANPLWNQPTPPYWVRQVLLRKLRTGTLTGYVSYVYKIPMHAVCETNAFRRAAAQAGMTEKEVFDLVDYLSANPTAGEEMEGTGGCRKVRVRGRGRGKSGGYRTITFYTGEMMPVYLITVFGKGEKANLTKRERNGLREITKLIVSEYQGRVTSVTKTKGVQR